VSNALDAVTSQVVTLQVRPDPTMVRAVSTAANAGELITIPLELVASGEENALNFSLSYNVSQLSLAEIIPGAAITNTQWLVNTTQTNAGRIGVALALSAGQTLAPGTQAVIQAVFATAVAVSNYTALLNFGDQPATRQVTDNLGQPLQAMYYGGQVTVWGTLSGTMPASAQLGTLQMPAISAKQIKQALPNAASGIYWLDPDGPGPGAPFQAYCEMTLDGGGWVLAINSVRGSEPSTADMISNTGVVGLNSGYTRDMSLLALARPAQILYHIQDGTNVFHAKWSGGFHDALPAVSAWTFITPGGTNLMQASFGRLWSTSNLDQDTCACNCAATYGVPWHYGACFSSLPSYPNDGLTQGPVNASFQPMDRFSIYVRELTTPVYNNPPLVANVIPNQSAIYGQGFNFAFAANTFTETDTGQTLSYAVIGLPRGMTFDGATRSFGGAPTQVGTFPITVIATDNGWQNLFAATAFSLRVSPPETLLSPNTISLTTGGQGSLVRFAGIPGRTYEIQRSTNLLNWTPLTNVIAPAHGMFSYWDTNPPAGSRYYRTLAR
jgi:hypothetical protein